MSIERPILFNTAMIQAILTGTKTQTRRQIKGNHNHIRFNGIAINGKAGYENPWVWVVEFKVEKVLK